MLHCPTSVFPPEQKVCGETPKKGTEHNETIRVQLSPLGSFLYFPYIRDKETKKKVLGVGHLAVRKGLWVHLPQTFSVAVQALT